MYKRIIFYLIISYSFAQTITPDITDEKKLLLVLTADESKPDDAIDRKISKIVAEVATSLGRYEVIDRNQLESIINEQALQQTGIIAENDIIDLGNIASANEAMKVQITHYSQKGVPPKTDDDHDDDDHDDDDDRGFWEMVIFESVKGAIRIATSPKGEEPYANNMETIIHADIILLDVETGQTLNTFPIGAMHTGGSRGKSLSKALSIIRMNVSRSLRELYTITSEVLDVQGSEVTMYLGSDLGVKRGIVYEISRLDKKKKLRDRDVTIPGRSVGLVRIDRVSDDASMGTIVRKWGRVKEGYKATEMINPPQGGFGFYFTYNNEREAIDRGGIAFQIKPFSRWGGHFHFGGGSMIDSRGDRDAMFSFGGGFIYRFLYTPKFNLSAVVDFPLDFVSRNDDYDHNVSTLLFAPQIGLQTEVMINRKVDLIVRAGYSRAKANGKWTYNEGEGDDTKSIDAKWDERGEPTLDAAGMYVNISLRFLAID